MDEQEKRPNEPRYVPLKSRGTGKIVPARIQRRESPYVPARSHGTGKIVPAKSKGTGKIVPAGTNQRRTAQPTKDSKLTDAERTRLKGILKDALTNVNYACLPDLDFGKNAKEYLVIGIPGAGERDFRGEFDALCEEVMLEDPFVLHAYCTRPYLQSGGRWLGRMPFRRHVLRSTENEKVMFSRLYSDRPIQFYSKLIPPNTAISTWAPPADLAHPPWFYGFLRNRTEIVIHLQAPSSYAPASSDNSEYRNRSLTSTSRPHGNSSSYNDYPAHEIAMPTVRAEFGAETPKPEISWQLDWGSTTETIAEFKNDALVVYNADRWLGHWLPYDILIDNNGGREKGHFVNPDFFDRIRITVSSNFGFDLAITKVAITLNDCEIFVLDTPVVLPKRSSVVLTFDEEDILEYKKPSLLWQRRTDFSNLEYHPQRILGNNFLSINAREYGKSWCRKQGSKWQKDDQGIWKSGPDAYCGPYTSWVVHEEGSLVNINPDDPFPQPDEWQTAKWYFNNSRLRHPFNTTWGHLGVRVSPGDYVNMWGHAAFFLYWIKVNPPEGGWLRDLRALANADEETEILAFSKVLNQWKPMNPGGHECHNLAPEPGLFDPFRDINWFCFVGGSMDTRVTIHAAAVINLYQWRDSVFDDGIRYREGVGYGVFLPWSHDHSEYHWWDRFQNSVSPPGFGRTDGEVVEVDFPPPKPRR